MGLHSSGAAQGRYHITALWLIKMLPYLILLFVAWALKMHYSRAGSDGLTWILWPVARLVEGVSTANFIYESGTGFVDHARRIVIAPGCAGVNFMIVAFCMTGCMVLPISRTFPGRMAWLGFSVASAYLMTIIANTLRIVIATVLYRIDFYGPWVTPAQVHRVAGIVVYLFLLYGLFALINSLKQWRPYILKKKMRTVMPLMWYAAMTIGVPMINGADTIGTRRFYEHCIMIGIAGAIVLLGIDLVHRAKRRRVGHRSKTQSANGAVNKIV